mmetsp:Transcript_40200/g.97030  ORF Transcript_40200/g.97030 Transcript_40200/m.97030 type:complete len:472 (+) Transcript_40200:201-1616(+)|eukprot:CAMPEP_0113655718 /NCGR_PEP_ID=MMETSP0017_2-20120614/29879_1 /TAXON_ID=2856 /ORGANISM="Cylindrotheca closterium" /LENGTH=471 /DNA_ID=CAMNT_0000569031 /DNA_START=112 /DNA_END=1527 /DNA_ORIENTATION=- /assembly_acc=CAM_ASM_000147
MNSSEASDSSLDGDDSTVSSKSNRNRLDGNNGGSVHRVADFSDMPSLASYRADEVSLASTLWTDCDQSLPSLSSYRTKDMSVASGPPRINNRQDDKLKNNDDDSDGSGTERTRGNISNSGRQQATPIASVTPAASIKDSVEEGQNAKPFPSSSREEDTPNTAALQRGGDSMPRLPTRRPMDDSVRSGSRQSESESDSESDMTDDSPDVSIDTDEENDDEVEPAHGPSHTVIPPARQLSPQSPKSPLRVNGVLPDVANPPLRVVDESSEPAAEKEKSKTSEDGMSPGEPEPPAIIATPPPIGNSSKSPKKKSPKRSPKKSPRKKKVKDKDKDSTRSQPEIGSPGIVEEKGQKRWRKKRSNQENNKTKKTPDRSASGNDTTRFFGRKNQSDKSHGVRRANSEMASVLESIKPEEEKKRGILKRFSSSLKQMVRPSRTLSGTLGHMTKIPSGGKKRSKLKKLSTKPDKQKTANA